MAKALNVTIDKFSSFSYSTSLPKADEAGYIDFFNITLTFSESVDSTLNLLFNRELVRDNNTNTLKNEKLSSPVQYTIPDRIFIEYPMNYTMNVQEYGKVGIPVISLSLSNYVV